MTNKKFMEKGEDGKYYTNLQCANCGFYFGYFTIREATMKVPLCDKCKATRKKVRR